MQYKSTSCTTVLYPHIHYRTFIINNNIPFNNYFVFFICYHILFSHTRWRISSEIETRRFIPGGERQRSKHACPYTYTNTCSRTHIHTCICTSIRIHSNTHTYTNILTDMHTYKYMHLHTYIHASSVHIHAPKNLSCQILKYNRCICHIYIEAIVRSRFFCIELDRKLQKSHHFI